jgi:Zn-finger nucleic acid-binding protein
MKCPRDGSELQEREQSKVKVDICPACKGIWLDAGELEVLSLVDRNPVRRVVDDLLKGLR